MKIATSLDWLSATTKGLSRPAAMLPLRRVIVKDIAKPFSWFDEAWTLNPAGTLHHSRRDGGLTMLLLSGADLVAWRKQGWQDVEMLNHLADVAASVTRLDYAVDLFDSGGCIDDLSAAYDAFQHKGSLRTAQRFAEKNGRGDTLYFGSKTSHSRVRVYDKAAEQKKLWLSWLRVELQTRKKKADGLAGEMRQHGIDVPGKQRIRELISFPSVIWYEVALIDRSVPLTTIPRKEPSLIRWFKSQILPAVDKVDD